MALNPLAGCSLELDLNKVYFYYDGIARLFCATSRVDGQHYIVTETDEDDSGLVETYLLAPISNVALAEGVGELEPVFADNPTGHVTEVVVDHHDGVEFRTQERDCSSLQPEEVPRGALL